MSTRNLLTPHERRFFDYAATGLAVAFFLAVMLGMI